MIRLDKIYDKIIGFGCSFTVGFLETDNASWVKFLSEKLNCSYEINGLDGVSNYHMMNSIIHTCETRDMTNICVGVQLTERCRRELWLNDEQKYLGFNLSTLHLNSYENLDVRLQFLKKNLDFFSSIMFDDVENLYRTVTTIVMLKNYFKNKNIDFIMFEGISSITEDVNIDNVFYVYKKILSKEYRLSLVNEKTFFNKYGPMQPFDRTHPLFDAEKNGGHPNSEFVKWWVDEMYEHIKNNQ